MVAKRVVESVLTGVAEDGVVPVKCWLVESLGDNNPRVLVDEFGGQLDVVEVGEDVFVGL